LAAHGLGRGKYCARVLAALAWEFIINREVLNVNPYGEWNESMLADEDLANDIRLHLQSLGKDITAEKLVSYLNSPEVREEHNIDKPISLTTARRYLDELGYRSVVS
jgi:phage terminase large subunit-like protein